MPILKLFGIHRYRINGEFKVRYMSERTAEKMRSYLWVEEI